MIGDDEQRVLAHALADLPNADADQRTQHAVIQHRDRPSTRQLEGDRDPLDRNEHQRDGGDGGENRDGAQHQRFFASASGTA
jgi:hypothetical protein